VGLALVHLFAEGADLLAGLSCPRQQFESAQRRSLGQILIVDSMTAALLTKMLAE
jgi:hypothetical protein